MITFEDMLAEFKRRLERVMKKHLEIRAAVRHQPGMVTLQHIMEPLQGESNECGDDHTSRSQL